MLQTNHVRSTPTTKLPKMAVDRQEHYSNGTPRALGVPCNATPSPMYLGVSPRPEPTTTLFIIISTTNFVTKLYICYIVVSSLATQGPTAGLWLRGHPTWTPSHGLPRQLPPPLVTIGPLVTPANAGSHCYKPRIPSFGPVIFY